MEQFAERNIIIGLLFCDDYTERIRKKLDIDIIRSSAAQIIAQWCLQYFDRFNICPQNDIMSIFAENRNSIDAATADIIQDVLETLIEENAHIKTRNVPFLIDQTNKYIRTQKLIDIADNISQSLERGEIDLAEDLVKEYTGTEEAEDNAGSIIDPFEDSDKVREAFEEQQEPILFFPKSLGEFWNAQMTRKSMIAIMAPEKRGKSFMLLEFAMRGVMAGRKVAFFQAGDMTESQQIRRMSIYLARRSDKEKHCKAMWVPCIDCWHNQTNVCTREQRECRTGVFDPERDKNKITYEELVQAAQEATSDYQPCRNCENADGTVWLVKSPETKPLQWKEAAKRGKRWREKYNAQFRLVTYSNETLTVNIMNQILDTWERKENFIPDIIVLDYADILAMDSDLSRMDERSQVNRTWQRLRRLSQDRNCLFVTVTQTAASSYNKETIDLEDFSNDKRKYAHATAVYALNQTQEEKKKGLVRIGELLVRDDFFDYARQVKVIQCLSKGRPIISSYF